MSNSTEVQVSSQPDQQTFNFEGHEVRVFMKDADPWFAAKDLCTALGLVNSRKALRALGEDEKGVTSSYSLGGEQQLAVVSEGGMWTLVLRCRDAVIEGTVPYRVRRWVTNEVLPAIRKTGVYVGKPFSVNPADVLTQEEQNTLRLMLKTAADRLPKEKRGALMVQGWSKLKSHFKVTYREIPRHEFSEAVSIIARHTAEFAEWEVVDKEPKPDAVSLDRLDTALAMAGEVAAVAHRHVMQAVLSGEDVSWDGSRWVFMFNLMDPRFSRGNGFVKNGWAKRIAHDVIVESPQELAESIRLKQYSLKDHDLAAIASACMQRLEIRCRNSPAVAH